MTHVLLAGVGGFFGAAARHALGGLVQRVCGAPAFPWGTLAVNLVGCLLIGLLAGVAEVRGPLSSEQRVLLFAGLLGGFTTFSAFGHETFELWRAGRPGLAGVNALAHLALGLLAVWGGRMAGRGI